MKRITKVCHWCFISTEFEQTSLEDSQNIVPQRNRTPKGPQSKSNENCYKAADIGGSMAKRELPYSHRKEVKRTVKHWLDMSLSNIVL